MIINKIFFSPTNSTKKVVDIISSPWENPSNDIDISDTNLDYSSYNFNEGDLCIVGVPSYGGRVPTIAIERLEKMKSNGSKTVIVTTYGNRDYDDTLLELKNTLTSRGFCIIAAIATVTQHSIVDKYGSGRPNNADIEELTIYGNKIKDAILSNLKLPEVYVKGNESYRIYNGVPLKPKAGKSCIKCGICATKCPTNAISKEDPRITNNDMCISCMRCISICPKQGRKLNPLMLFVAGKKMKKACITPKSNEFYGII